ncbi:peptidase s1c [Trichococcus palustris]|jgi:serine protease Do|uniref:Peptidase s1c n=1 Tax=Trichococcus palustris TaxID=140314 RepID=A0A143YI38_9LACT|nr:S1C family serine protease [Trichococcus palustris]CZQ88902.1 peptidase s1c [Trichococcus palustris]SFL00504.1 serine protease Do [Trichococcus palustris]
MDGNEENKNLNKSDEPKEKNANKTEPSATAYSQTEDAQPLEGQADQIDGETAVESGDVDAPVEGVMGADTQAEQLSEEEERQSRLRATVPKEERINTLKNSIDEEPNPRKPKEKKSSPIKNGIIGGIIGGGVVALIGAGLLLGSGLLANQTTGGQSNTTKVSDVALNITTDTTAAVEKVQDAVVSIINMQKGSNNVFGLDIPQKSSETSDGNLQTSSEGSGVIYKIEGDLAYIVTNNHVIDGADELEILLKDGTKEVATVVGSDIWTDLAVLTIPAKNVTTVATFGDSDKVNVGEPAIAIGSPLGTEFATSVTQGIISAKNRSVATDVNGDGVVDWDVTALQTDASINPGNSGGALINIAGQVIGINSMKISDPNVEGMGFAIPSNDVVTIINELEKNGEIIRPVLGVSMLDLSQISATQQQTVLKLPEGVTEGVVVAEVQPLSAAELGGIKQYDVITEMNGKSVTSIVDLRKILYTLAVGSKVEIKYYRDGELQTTTVTLTDGQSSTK